MITPRADGTDGSSPAAQELQEAKAVVRAHYAALDAAEGAALAGAMAAHTTADLIWRGYHPFHLIRGPGEVARAFWIPLRDALSHGRRRLDLFFAGRNDVDGGATVWVGTMGHIMGLFDRPWLGIRPTGKLVMLRYAAFHRVDGGRIAETAMFFDIPHLMAQAGQPVFETQAGASLVQPGPAPHDGLLYAPQEPAEGAATLAAINRMIGDLAVWKKPDEMPVEEELRRSWTEDMIWWGPAGIGATYTIPRYADQHVRRFRQGFRDRRFNGHVARLAEGAYGGFFGWPNLTLTPAGGLLGLEASDIPGDMRVIDMYRRAGDKLAENWIFIDMLHFLKQQGRDVLGEL